MSHPPGSMVSSQEQKPQPKKYTARTLDQVFRLIEVAWPTFQRSQHDARNQLRADNHDRELAKMGELRKASAASSRELLSGEVRRVSVASPEGKGSLALSAAKLYSPVGIVGNDGEVTDGVFFGWDDDTQMARAATLADFNEANGDVQSLYTQNKVATYAPRFLRLDPNAQMNEFTPEVRARLQDTINTYLEHGHSPDQLIDALEQTFAAYQLDMPEGSTDTLENQFKEIVAKVELADAVVDVTNVPADQKQLLGDRQVELLDRLGDELDSSIADMASIRASRLQEIENRLGKPTAGTPEAEAKTAERKAVFDLHETLVTEARVEYQQWVEAVSTNIFDNTHMAEYKLTQRQAITNIRTAAAAKRLAVKGLAQVGDVELLNKHNAAKAELLAGHNANLNKGDRPTDLKERAEQTEEFKSQYEKESASLDTEYAQAVDERSQLLEQQLALVTTEQDELLQRVAGLDPKNEASEIDAAVVAAQSELAKAKTEVRKAYRTQDDARARLRSVSGPKASAAEPAQTSDGSASPLPVVNPDAAGLDSEATTAANVKNLRDREQADLVQAAPDMEERMARRLQAESERPELRERLEAEAAEIRAELAQPLDAETRERLDADLARINNELDPAQAEAQASDAEPELSEAVGAENEPTEAEELRVETSPEDQLNEADPGPDATQELEVEEPNIEGLDVGEPEVDVEETVSDRQSSEEVADLEAKLAASEAKGQLLEEALESQRLEAAGQAAIAAQIQAETIETMVKVAKKVKERAEAKQPGSAEQDESGPSNRGKANRGEIIEVELAEPVNAPPPSSFSPTTGATSAKTTQPQPGPSGGDATGQQSNPNPVRIRQILDERRNSPAGRPQVAPAPSQFLKIKALTEAVGNAVGR